MNIFFNNVRKNIIFLTERVRNKIKLNNCVIYTSEGLFSVGKKNYYFISLSFSHGVKLNLYISFYRYIN